ncbi:MAG: 50S ribosomal protein L31 type B [Candidatus Parcubacteria bacterium]|nr:MAG: 50S ribosomal protein L31 type B [Candidatus Parcubacteria bacterium]
MKKGIHPQNYRPVLFHDITADAMFVVYSTVHTTERRVGPDGKEYDYKPLEISSASHPFFTGEQTIVDTAGRVGRFLKKLEAARKARESKPKSARNTWQANQSEKKV